ncbi:hypothetical protein [Rhodanobacter sp. 7MK24]|uniref:hypothetical protein n=1 Tax=Rhodanobacter sp. 7MK24 TaxID=2775922 RepID=UPI001CE1AB91|nr:hypothetical protein [Rhodanobacter sp. 7MK24]
MLGMSMFGAFAGVGLLMGLVGLVVVVVVSALLLSLAYRLVVGHMPSFARALGTVLASWLASVVVSLILHGGAGHLLSFVAQFLVGALVINLLLPGQDGSQVGYGKACVVQLVYMVIFFVLAFVLALLFGGMMLAMLHH